MADKKFSLFTPRFSSLIPDRDSPTADLHDPQISEHLVRPCGHRGPRDGGRQRPHETERKEEGGTEERPAATDIQRGQILRGE